jgi:hypothetical protein
MSPTTVTSAAPRWRHRSRVRDPDAGAERIGSAGVERRSRPAGGSGDVPAVLTAPAPASGRSWQRARAVIGGVAAVVFLGTLGS